MSRTASLRYLLLQVRNADDPMRTQEVACFAANLGVDVERITPLDLLSGFPSPGEIARHDVVLFGGSGDYSAAGEGAWLEPILDGMRQLFALRKPTFASCWGFQAFSRALGGSCIHDPDHAELGSIELQLTEAGAADPVFGILPPDFLSIAGHEDRVANLPPGAVLLAQSNLVEQQAYTFPDAPIYATQFHPELDLTALIQRLEAYPRYVEQISGLPLDEFSQHCQETPEANRLLRRFVEVVFA